MDILFLSISFFAIVVLWIASNLYHTWVTTTISDDLQLQIVPIAPKFDTATIEKLKTREKIDAILELNNTKVASSGAEDENIIQVIEGEPIPVESTFEEEALETPTPTEPVPTP